MKKFLSILLSLTLCLTSVAGLAGCQTPPCNHADSNNDGYCDSCTAKIGNWFVVTFKVNGATSSTQEVYQGKTATAPTNPTAPSGQVFKGWKTASGDTWDFTNPVTGHMTLTAEFGADVQTVQVQLYLNEACTELWKNVDAVVGQTMADPGIPSKPATETHVYNFIKWVNTATGEEWNFATDVVTEETFLYAVFEAVEDTRTRFNVYYYNDDRTSLIATQRVADGDRTSKPVEVPTKAATANVEYEFSHWETSNGTVFNFEVSSITAETSLYAVYTESYTGTVIVTLKNGDANYKVWEVNAGDTLSKYMEENALTLTDPSKADTAETKYVFAGWETEAKEEWSLSSDIVTSSITLYAKYDEYNKGQGGDSTWIRLGGYVTDPTQKTAYSNMIAAFNKTYGLEAGITAIFAPQGSWADYQNAALTQLTSAVDPYHVYMINDRNFKTWAQQYSDKIVNIGAEDGKFTKDPTFQDQLDGMWSGMIDRFRLDTVGWTSYEDDPLWAVPVDSNPTALYYNRTVLERNGIIVISVEDTLITEEVYQSLAARATKMYDLHCDDQGVYDGEPVGYYNGIQDLEQTKCVGKTLMELWNADLIEDMFGNTHYNLLFETGSSILDYYGKRTIESDFLSYYNITVPAKGFYRSENPRDVRLGISGIQPPVECGTDEKYTEPLVFNASIAMSWDEMEDVALLCTRSVKHNTNSASAYGFYTQWWFAYGWSVGGDCVEDLTGDGAWSFSLSDYSANYMVTEAALDTASALDPSVMVYKGVWTGKEYHAGDILSFLDKMDVDKLAVQAGQDATAGDIVVPADDGGYYTYDINGNRSRLGMPYSEVLAAGRTNDNTCIRPAIVNASSIDQNAANIKFIELPSTREAFARFCHLCPGADEESLSVSQVPTSGSDETKDINLLGQGDVAFMIERGDKLGAIRNATAGNGHSWGVANVPVFKEYVEGAYGTIDPNSDTVKRQGVLAGHSECVALGISAGCPADLQDEAWQFIQWMSADYYYVSKADGSLYFGKQKSPEDTRKPAGQAVKANNGFIPNQQGLFEAQENSSDTFIKVGEENLNLHLFAYAIEYESAGDWWYLPNGSSTWISNWASSLNSTSGVRGGSMSLATWYNSIISSTNSILHATFNNYYKDGGNIEEMWSKEFGAK